MRSSRWWWLVLGLWVTPTLAQDSIYSWTDDQGRVHYGDKKSEDKRVNTLNLSTTPSIQSVNASVINEFLPGRWQYNLSQGRGKASLHFRDDHRVTGSLPLDGDELQAFRGTWRLIDGWIVLEVVLLDAEQDPERAVNFAITELAEHTMVQTARDGSKTYWYYTGRR